MVQILDRLSPRAQTMGNLGASLGTGLQSLAQMKLQEVQQKQQARGLQALAPQLSPEQAFSLSKLPSQVLGPALKSMMEQPYNKMVEERFAGIEPTENQMFANLQQLTPSQQIGTEVSAGLQKPSEQIAQQPQMPAVQQRPINKYAGLKAKDIATLRKLEQGEEKVAIQKQESARKYIEPYVKATEKATEMNKRYKNIIKAAQSGELRAGTKQAMMEKLGIGNYWRNPTTEQAQTDINALALGVASAFGPGMGRILSKEFEAYKDSLVRTWNTPEGMVAISRNEILKNDLIETKQNARRNIIKQNKGIVPFDIEAQIDESIMPIAKAIANKMDKNFQEVLSNKMPKWGSRELNPSKYKEGTVAELETGGNQYKIINGVWEPVY